VVAVLLATNDLNRVTKSEFKQMKNALF